MGLVTVYTSLGYCEGYQVCKVLSTVASTTEVLSKCQFLLLVLVIIGSLKEGCLSDRCARI